MPADYYQYIRYIRSNLEMKWISSFAIVCPWLSPVVCDGAGGSTQHSEYVKKNIFDPYLPVQR